MKPVWRGNARDNKIYVFALPARYNYAFPTGFEEVEDILENYSLQANENIYPDNGF